jgi:hypothetical protein
MPRLCRFAPVRWRVFQVSRHVVAGRGPSVICAEHSHDRSEQPDQRSTAGSHQPLLDSIARKRTAIAGGDADLRSACPQGANGLGPPPTLTAIESPPIPAL